MHTGAMCQEQQKPFMDQEALDKDGAISPTPEGNGGTSTSMLTLVGFAFLTFHSGMAVYRSDDGAMGAISFVAFSFLDVALLFYCLRLYNRTPPGSPRREDLKMAVWLLSVMLTLAAFVLLEFWFSSSGASGAGSGTTPPLQHQSHPSIPWP